LRRGGAKVPITLRLDEATFAQLRLLAEAENRSPTNYVETTVLRDLAAKAEAVRVMTMFVPPDAAAAVPGVLLRTEGESDERYTERAALMERLFAVADTE
jgi:hypothetical protein